MGLVNCAIGCITQKLEMETLSTQFLTDNFLLYTETAQLLYYECASKMPVIDYHCHLPPSEIASDRQFENLTQIWLQGDHYKWRAMRTLGVDEKYITGDASDAEKFYQWATTVPYTLRNPLYHWTHMELKAYFGTDYLLNRDTAQTVYKTANEQLQTPAFSTRNLLRKMNVEVVCTTDDPADTLEYHRKIKEDGFEVKVLPTFRPDNAFAFEKPAYYNKYLDRLEEAAGISISSLDDLLTALENRIDFFNDNGCRLSDHGLEKIFFESHTDEYSEQLNRYFTDVRSGKPLHSNQIRALKHRILLELGKMYHQKGWVQQFHLGTLRNTNERMMNKLGPDSGFDSIGDFSQARNLADFLNELDRTEQLTKTILYNSNPADNEVIATMTGNFNDGSVKGKMQYGSAWWFLDQKDGIEKQLNVLSNMGLLSCFIGMLTDSRSFLSYPRHEYFRRILCNLIGADVEKGELPDDMELLKELIADVCYNNAKEYFNF